MNNTLQPIDFYFDFSSPYGYLASRRIDDLGNKYGRAVNWYPYLMGAGFKRTGRQPLVNVPVLNVYSLNDINRSARFYHTELNFPDKFPIASVATCRAYYWIYDQSPESAKKYARAAYRAYFVEGRDVSRPETVVEVAVELGHDESAVGAALRDDAVKARVREVTENALDSGIFGSPFVIVDGEQFWGNDRFQQIERWLAEGPF